MNFDFTDDQQTIKATARELLASRSPFERVRAAAEARRYDDDLWLELCELGWPGIAVGEEHGGQGLGAVELAVLLEELGYAVAATPLLGTVLAATAIEHGGSDAQRTRWLPSLAAGELKGAYGTGGELVVDGADADVIVVADAGAPRLVAREDADVEPVDAIDPTRRYARVQGDGEALAGDAEGALGRVGIAVAAELVGVCQRALDMTVGYVKERKQFGVPVGSFQAVSHRCAQMLLLTEGARSAAYFGAWAADAAPERLAEAAGLACAVAGEAGREVSGSAIQAHGGIGFTWEADVHWLYKRAQLDAALLGSGSGHRIRLARLVAARRAPAAA
jgi:alkylation response protein AidB-like acyl-CoA dehydrogenase